MFFFFLLIISYSVYIVLKAPSIVGFKNVSVNQDVNKTITLKCNVSGNPRPDVKWEHRGKSLNYKHKINNVGDCSASVQDIYLKEGSDDTLYICGLDYKKHSGSFTCVATNIVNTTSKNMMLSVLGIILFCFVILLFRLFYFLK